MENIFKEGKNVLISVEKHNKRIWQLRGETYKKTNFTK